MRTRKPYTGPCYTDGTSGAECGRANVPITADKAAVRCAECRGVLGLPRRKPEPEPPAYVYGVFEGSRSAITRDVAQANEYAATHTGVRVSRMSADQYDDPGCVYGWDWPTFRMLAEPLPDPNLSGAD